MDPIIYLVFTLASALANEVCVPCGIFLVVFFVGLLIYQVVCLIAKGQASAK